MPDHRSLSEAAPAAGAEACDCFECLEQECACLSGASLGAPELSPVLQVRDGVGETKWRDISEASRRRLGAFAQPLTPLDGAFGPGGYENALLFRHSANFSALDGGCEQLNVATAALGERSCVLVAEAGMKATPFMTFTAKRVPKGDALHGRSDPEAYAFAPLELLPESHSPAGDALEQALLSDLLRETGALADALRTDGLRDLLHAHDEAACCAARQQRGAAGRALSAAPPARGAEEQMSANAQISVDLQKSTAAQKGSAGERSTRVQNPANLRNPANGEKSVRVDSSTTVGKSANGEMPTAPQISTDAQISTTASAPRQASPPPAAQDPAPPRRLQAPASPLLPAQTADACCSSPDGACCAPPESARAASLSEVVGRAVLSTMVGALPVLDAAMAALPSVAEGGWVRSTALRSNADAWALLRSSCEGERRGAAGGAALFVFYFSDMVDDFVAMERLAKLPKAVFPLRELPAEAMEAALSGVAAWLIRRGLSREGDAKRLSSLLSNALRPTLHRAAAAWLPALALYLPVRHGFSTLYHSPSLVMNGAAAEQRLSRRLGEAPHEADIAVASAPDPDRHAQRSVDTELFVAVRSIPETIYIAKELCFAVELALRSGGSGRAAAEMLPDLAQRIGIVLQALPRADVLSSKWGDGLRVLEGAPHAFELSAMTEGEGAPQCEAMRP